MKPGEGAIITESWTYNLSVVMFTAVQDLIQVLIMYH